MKTRLMLAAAIATAALAGCATSPGYGPSYGGGYDNGAGSYSRNSCYDCGVVVRVDTVSSGRTAPSATGAVLGGIVGAVAGRQISEHTGGSKGNKNTATVAGAAAGALAGNAIQNRTAASYDVTVRMDDGRTVTINQRNLGGIRENAYVRVVNGQVVLR